MTKDKVAQILEKCGTLLELTGENAFRVNAYHNGARALRQLEIDLEDLVVSKKLDTVSGIGKTLQEKITTLVTTGKLPFYEELKAKVPTGLVEMLRLPSVGPKKIKAMYDELGIDDLDKLRVACQEGTVAKLKGFGAKTQSKILEGLEFLDKMGSRVRIDQALFLAEHLLEQMKKVKGVKRIELCGSLRRKRETIKDIDILISSSKSAPIMKAFVELPEVIQVTGHGDTKSSIVVQAETEGGIEVVMNADLRVVEEKSFPFALNYFTGSKEHNVAMRQRAIKYGLKLNEYELAGDKKSVACKDEADLYDALDLQYVEPELRENTGEIEAAAERKLPDLIKEEDIQGTFHCHTTYSDGKASLPDMAEAAKKLGLKYFGFGDHSQSLTIANGLSPERVKHQHAEIDDLSKKLKGIRLFKGIECDILPDGSMDYDDDILASFDYVVASVHTHFNQTRAEVTARVIRAIENPHVTMLGHATGRLILRREGYPVDLEEVIQAAAKNGTMIEINAHPQRLDLDWVHCKRAKALRVKLVVNPDAHTTDGIAAIKYGVHVARRGWLEKSDVFNTQSAANVAEAFQRK